MKKIILALVFCMFCVTKGFCAQNVTYSAKSTVTEDNAQEVIKLEVIPVIDVNNKPVKNFKNDSVYVAPLINPAQEKKPTLNFNLNNIKNIKKGSIFPDDNVNQTITNVVQYFNAPYDKVFSHIIGIVDNSDLELVSYDTKTGRIFSNYQNEKPVYITVSQYNTDNVMVKITPADGIYNIPVSVIDKIFADLNRSLAIK